MVTLPLHHVISPPNTPQYRKISGLFMKNLGNFKITPHSIATLLPVKINETKFG